MIIVSTSYMMKLRLKNVKNLVAGSARKWSLKFKLVLLQFEPPSVQQQPALPPMMQCVNGMTSSC